MQLKACRVLKRVPDTLKAYCVVELVLNKLEAYGVVL